MCSPNTFHPFPNLAFEIRHMIWTLCIPHRVLDLDWLPEEDDKKPSKCCGFCETGRKNDVYPPLISYVCQEARSACKERNHGIPKADWWGLQWEYFTRLGKDHQGQYLRAWFNRETDVVNMTKILPGYYGIYQHPCYYGPSSENGAFGRLGEEFYVLVKPSDPERIRQFQRPSAVASPIDEEAKQSLEHALDTTSTGLQRGIEKWVYELQVYWIQFKCEQATRRGVPRLWDFDEIWNESVEPSRRRQSFSKGPGADWKGLFREDQPFIIKVLEEMPRFEPVIMFRLCELDCLGKVDC